MTDHNAPIRKHKGTLKEHLAGVKGAAKEIQTLAAEHLLRTQDPISKQPVKSPEGPQS